MSKEIPNLLTYPDSFVIEYIKEGEFVQSSWLPRDDDNRAADSDRRHCAGLRSFDAPTKCGNVS